MTKLYDIIVKTPTKNLLDAFTYKSDHTIETGSLVKIDFNGRETFGIIYRVRQKSNLSLDKINEIKKVLSSSNIIHERALLLAKWMSSYYATPIGEVLFALLPIPEIAADLAKPLSWQKESAIPNNIHISGAFPNRLVRYVSYINESISSNEQVLLLVPNYRLVDYTVRYFNEVLGTEFVAEISDRLGRKELRKRLGWLQNNRIKLVIGTRKSIFLPCNKLSTIIIDQPTNFGYWNDQKPAYTSARIAWKLNELFNIRIILGDNLPDLESILLARRAKLQLISITRLALTKQRESRQENNNSAKLIWQIEPSDDTIKNLSGNLNLIITPYLDALNHDDHYSAAATNIARNIKHTHSIISSKEHNFKLPLTRPFTAIATKKILDYPELIFDNSLIIAADLWLSLPSYDAAMEFVTLVWQIWQQTKKTVIIQSSRPVPLIEKLLSNRPGQALARFMQSRQKFNLPPYSREVVIKSKKTDEIMKLLPQDANPVVAHTTVTAYFKPHAWPPDNINSIYRKTTKISIDQPK